MFEATAKSAMEYARQNNVEEWIHTFLCGEGDNKDFSDGLKLEERIYSEPKLMKLDLFKRCYGPEPDMKWRCGEDFWDKVNEIAERYETGDWDMPPLIINDDNGVYELNDGNHRFAALKSLNITEYWVIIWKCKP